MEENIHKEDFKPAKYPDALAVNYMSDEIYTIYCMEPDVRNKIISKEKAFFKDKLHLLSEDMRDFVNEWIFCLLNNKPIKDTTDTIIIKSYHELMLVEYKVSPPQQPIEEMKNNALQIKGLLKADKIRHEIEEIYLDKSLSNDEKIILIGGRKDSFKFAKKYIKEGAIGIAFDGDLIPEIKIKHIIDTCKDRLKRLNREKIKEIVSPQQITTQTDAIKYTAKHYVLTYLIECHAKGESFPIGNKKELERIGNERMGTGKGNRFYKLFNEIINKDLNAENNLIEIGGENWRKTVKELTKAPELVEQYLQNKQL
ncbi:MAG: hypothetical protein RBS73_11040 [Prolixibacteraceae bacterium]|jgi:hypothetical protein|nr:hypothetical protein [Prolixibacteraceae bacterium]